MTPNCDDCKVFDEKERLAAAENASNRQLFGKLHPQARTARRIEHTDPVIENMCVIGKALGKTQILFDDQKAPPLGGIDCDMRRHPLDILRLYTLGRFVQHDKVGVFRDGATE